MNPQSYGTVPSIQVCQPGFDVRSCPDWAYLFNGNWPNLAIAFEITIANPGGLTTINHNLGFFPLVMVWNYFKGIGSYGRQSTGFSVDKSTVTIAPVNHADFLTIVCFNIDISVEVEYPLPQSPQAKLPYNNQFGIKVAKDNRPIASNDLNDFVIHSRAQSPAVLAVATQKGKYYTTVSPGSAYSSPWIVYPIKTSYIPWAYCAQINGSGKYAFETVNALQFINNQLVFALQGASGGSLIILRDPLFYPNTVEVVF